MASFLVLVINLCAGIGRRRLFLSVATPTQIPAIIFQLPIRSGWWRGQLEGISTLALLILSRSDGPSTELAEAAVVHLPQHEQHIRLWTLARAGCVWFYAFETSAVLQDNFLAVFHGRIIETSDNSSYQMQSKVYSVNRSDRK